jgi:hypothetical protein
MCSGLSNAGLTNRIPRFKIASFTWTGICSRVASDNNIDVYADSVSELISKWIGDVVPTVTIKTFLNEKPWIDDAKLRAWTTAFNQGKATENMTEYKKYSYSLHKAIKKAKRRVTLQRLKPNTYVAGSTVNHGLQKENQPRHGHWLLAPRQIKQLLCLLLVQ